MNRSAQTIINASRDILQLTSTFDEDSMILYLRTCLFKREFRRISEIGASPAGFYFLNREKPLLVKELGYLDQSDLADYIAISTDAKTPVYDHVKELTSSYIVYSREEAFLAGHIPRSGVDEVWRLLAAQGGTAFLWEHDQEEFIEYVQRLFFPEIDLKKCEDSIRTYPHIYNMKHDGVANYGVRWDEAIRLTRLRFLLKGDNQEAVKVIVLLVDCYLKYGLRVYQDIRFFKELVSSVRYASSVSDAKTISKGISELNCMLTQCVKESKLKQFWEGLMAFGHISSDFASTLVANKMEWLVDELHACFERFLKDYDKTFYVIVSEPFDDDDSEEWSDPEEVEKEMSLHESLDFAFDMEIGLPALVFRDIYYLVADGDKNVAELFLNRVSKRLRPIFHNSRWYAYLSFKSPKDWLRPIKYGEGIWYECNWRDGISLKRKTEPDQFLERLKEEMVEYRKKLEAGKKSGESSKGVQGKDAAGEKANKLRDCTHNSIQSFYNHKVHPSVENALIYLENMICPKNYLESIDVLLESFDFIENKTQWQTHFLGLVRHNILKDEPLDFANMFDQDYSVVLDASIEDTGLEKRGPFSTFMIGAAFMAPDYLVSLLADLKASILKQPDILRSSNAWKRLVKYSFSAAFCLPRERMHELIDKLTNLFPEYTNCETLFPDSQNFSNYFYSISIEELKQIVDSEAAGLYEALLSNPQEAYRLITDLDPEHTFDIDLRQLERKVLG